MAKLDDLLTLQEASEEFRIGYQTLRAAAASKRLKVARWTKRGDKDTPLLVDRAEVQKYAANRQTRTGRKSFDKAADTLGIDPKTAEQIWQAKESGEPYSLRFEKGA